MTVQMFVPQHRETAILRFLSDGSDSNITIVRSLIEQLDGRLALTRPAPLDDDPVLTEFIVAAANVGHAEQIRDVLDNAAISMEDRSFADYATFWHEGGAIRVVPTAPSGVRMDLLMDSAGAVRGLVETIDKHPECAYDLTSATKTVALVSNGSAVPGIGKRVRPRAVLPLLEGRSAMLNELAGVNASPLCLTATLADEIVATAVSIAPSFAVIAIEGIIPSVGREAVAALNTHHGVPALLLREHGLAASVAAAVQNGLLSVGKDLTDSRVAILGAEDRSPALEVGQTLQDLGVSQLAAYDSSGPIHLSRKDLRDETQRWFAANAPSGSSSRPQSECYPVSDVIIDLSPTCSVTSRDVQRMPPNPIVITLSTSVSMGQHASLSKEAAVVATGTPGLPNFLSENLSLPGLIRGMLMARITRFTPELVSAVAPAIADCAQIDQSTDWILPSITDPRLVGTVSQAVFRAAHNAGISG